MFLCLGNDRFNMGATCYNKINFDYYNMTQTMKPGKKSEYPNNLFNSWLEFRIYKGQKLAEIIRETNEKLDRKYDNNSFYRWKTEKLTLAEVVLHGMILPELEDLLKFIFETNDFPKRNIDFNLLGDLIKPPVKSVARDKEI